MKEKMNGVPDTLFIPLKARVYVSTRFPEYFYDEKSIEIYNKVDIKIKDTKWEEYFSFASAARTSVLDNIAKNFINENKNCNVISLGGGLDTQYYRLDQPKINYYSIDFDDIVTLRKKFLKESQYEKFIASDVFNYNWMKQIDPTLPSLFVASGLLIYFTNKQVIELLKAIQKTFKKSEFAFDITNSKGLKTANRYVKKTGNKNALMHFAVDKNQNFIKQIQGAKLISVHPFYKRVLKLLGKKLKFKTRLFMKIADKTNRTKVLHIALNLEEI